MTEIIGLWGGSAIVAVLQFLIIWAVWSFSQKYCTNKKCAEHRKKMTDQASNDVESLAEDFVEVKKELDDLKDQVSKLPDRTEMEKFSSQIGEVNKTLGKLEGRLNGIGRAVDLMNQFLINNGNSKETK